MTIREKYVYYGTPIVWRAAGGNHVITLASLGSGVGRCGPFADLATPSLVGGRARSRPKYSVQLEINMDVAPVAGTVVELWWSPSIDGTTFAGGASGTNLGYSGSALGTVAESKLQMIHVGSIILTPDADGTVQRGTFIFSPPTQFGAPVVINLGGQMLEGDGDSHAITFTPILEEVA